jgi:hypothetical protein
MEISCATVIYKFDTGQRKRMEISCATVIYKQHNTKDIVFNKIWIFVQDFKWNFFSEHKLSLNLEIMCEIFITPSLNHQKLVNMYR